MEIKTTRFGAIEVDENSVIRMERGPLGFDEETEFTLVKHRDGRGFTWLQSLSDPDLAFVAVDPISFFTDYEIEISDADAERLDLTSEEDAMVLTIVTVDKDAAQVTANLAAPIVINSKNLMGAQIVLQDERYPIRHPLIGKEVAEPVAAKAA